MKEKIKQLTININVTNSKTCKRLDTQTKMLNHLKLHDNLDTELSNSAFFWWRSAQEFDSNGNLSFDISNLSSLTPRLKVLRELERLALVAPDGLEDLRHKLICYRSGDFLLPIGGIKKEDMDIPPIITILLVGFSGSGKSSLVNLMYSVLGRSGLIPFAQTSSSASKYTTLFMEENNVLRSVRSGFCVYDSRGLDYQRVSEGVEGVVGWMVDGVYHHQPCWRSGDDLMRSKVSSARLIKRRVNSSVVVVNLAEVYRGLIKGNAKPLEAIKELFCCSAIRKCNENPILILTHGDMLTTEERIDGRIKICEFLGISEATGAYDIACLTEYGFLADESDPVTAYALTEAIYRVLLFSDRSHSPKKKLKDWVILCISWFLFVVSSFFAFLAYMFTKLSQRSKLKQ